MEVFKLRLLPYLMLFQAFALPTSIWKKIQPPDQDYRQYLLSSYMIRNQILKDKQDFCQIVRNHRCLNGICLQALIPYGIISRRVSVAFSWYRVFSSQLNSILSNFDSNSPIYQVTFPSLIMIRSLLDIEFSTCSMIWY